MILIKRRTVTCSVHETMPSSNPQDWKLSWSPEWVYPDGGEHSSGGLFDPEGDGAKLGGAGNLAFRFPDNVEGRLQDGNITNHAVEVIADMAAGKYGADVASGERPFSPRLGYTNLCVSAPSCLRLHRLHLRRLHRRLRRCGASAAAWST